MESLHFLLWIIVFILVLILGVSVMPGISILALDDNESVNVNVTGPITSDDAVAVNVVDQTTRPLDFFFVQTVGNATTLNNTVSMDQTSMIVVDVTDFIIGTYVGVFSGVSGEGRFYFAEVLAVTGSNLSLDTPFDFNFSAGDPVIPLTRDLNIDGSIECETFVVGQAGLGSNVSFDITRLIFSMTMSTAGDDSRFGNIGGGLANGIVVRRTNGESDNIFNTKTNGELFNLAFDGEYTDKTGGGNFGFRTRYSFAGPDKHGVAVRIAPGESLDLIVCDDLSSLLSFRVVGAGHIVDVSV